MLVVISGQVSLGHEVLLGIFLAVCESLAGNHKVPSGWWVVSGTVEVCCGGGGGPGRQGVVVCWGKRGNTAVESAGVISTTPVTFVYVCVFTVRKRILYSIRIRYYGPLLLCVCVRVCVGLGAGRDLVYICVSRVGVCSEVGIKGGC